MARSVLQPRMRLVDYRLVIHDIRRLQMLESHRLSD